jgi:hypothetical protein
MTETSAQAAVPAVPTASRGRLILARTLTVIGVLLVVISVLANFVKREALDPAQFRDTSRQLVANDRIRSQLAVTLVDELYSNVDVAAQLQARLPKTLQGLAGPIAGAAREGSSTVAKTLLEQPRVQALFVNAASLAQKQFVAVLDGNTKVLDTTNGKVVLDLRPIVLRLGNRFSFISNLQGHFPAGSAQVTLLKSDQLKTAQRGTRALRFVASWIWVFALLAWAAAVWLARGRRRIEVRAIALGIVISGFLILVVRTILGRYLVNHLVASDSVKPSVSEAYDIITRLLKGAGWTAVIVGIVALVGVWLAGPGRRATDSRRWLAPYLRRPEIAYGVVLVAYLLLLWWKPTPQFAFLLNVVLFLVLLLGGLEVLRRLTDREFPDAQPGALAASARSAVTSMRRTPTPAPQTGASDEIERLARLHAEGALDDAEFAAAKERVLAGSGPQG